MPQQEIKSIRSITAGCFFAYLIFGFADNIKGPTLPALLSDLHLNYSQAGTILLAPSAGILVATILAGILSDVVGKRSPMFVGSVSLFLGILAYSYCSSLWSLTISMFALGFGFGCLHIGANAIIVDLHQQKGRFLNLLHFFHGLGSMIAPAYVWLVFTAHLTWRHVYRFSLPLVVLLFLYFLIFKYPKTAGGDLGFNFNNIRSAVSTSRMGLLYFLFALSVATEVGLAAWLVEFLQQAKYRSSGSSRIFFLVYFAAVTLGRLVASFVVQRVGYLKTILIGLVTSIVCITLGIFGPLILVLLLIVTGFFFATVLPTTAAEVSEIHSANRGTILGLLFAFGAVGGMLGPKLIGQCSYWWGIKLGFSVLLLFCFAMLAGLLILMKKSVNGKTALA